ncbi:hypothetical protein VTL71DRAFT_13049 [Oculimacula yallundae]|uniref:Alginate biosynthesis protein AlgF n=1 Tax=Oculimacula yallundae TaxID=86028 RepID=A0ABR4CPG3_9HELO
MRGFAILCLAVQATGVLAAPAFKALEQKVEHVERRQIAVIELVNPNRKNGGAAVTVTVTVTAPPPAGTGGAAVKAGEKKEPEEKKTRTKAALAQAVLLKGGMELQAVSFVGSTGTGAIEIEYQNADARTLTVTENKSPAAPPAGFKFIDTSSYVVTLAEGAGNITRQQIDYVFNLNSTAVKAVNISAVRTGKLCTEAKSFVVSDALGAHDFEADEGESVLKVNSMLGEWGLFAPI